jgi:ABC-2 type transport system ATP-binding protein
MKRRLNLACALLHKPSLLLLDEPTVGLDIASRDAMFDVLRRLKRQGVAIVLATHHLDEAQALCDRVAILDRGRLVLEGRLDDIIRRYRSRAGYFTTGQAPTTLEEILRGVIEKSGVDPVEHHVTSKAEAA